MGGWLHALSPRCGCLHCTTSAHRPICLPACIRACCSGTTVTKEIIEAGKNLKVIGRAGVGIDNVDVAEATRR